MKTFAVKLWVGSVAMVSLLGLGSGAMAEAPRADILPPPAGDAAQLYEKSCGKCHGADGKGETGMAKKGREKGERWPDLTVSKLESDKVLAIIKDGVPDTKMKGYGDKLNGAELKALTDFVIGLRK